MSRIGKLPITLPEEVDAKLEGDKIVIKGPKGELQQKIARTIKVNIGVKEITCSPVEDTKESRAQWGLYRVLINNMVIGVTKGYTKNLEIIGVGYRAEIRGKDLILNVGYSNPVTISHQEGIEFSIQGPTKIEVKGIDKHSVGQVAANIRKVRPPEPFKGKGIRYAGEMVRRKAGKAGAK